MAKDKMGTYITLFGGGKDSISADCLLVFTRETPQFEKKVALLVSLQ